MAAVSAPEIAAIDHYLALSYLRLGELENCIVNHTTASCLFPIQQAGYHKLPMGSEMAIEEMDAMSKEILIAMSRVNTVY